MIWYLLSPIRGTSEPPRLSDNHFIRRAFYRHGIFTAQHWLASMLVSCGIAAALAYPTVFISGDPTAGFTSRPHQIWAASRTVNNNENLNVDIEMRQIWIHGTYMRALDKDVLQSALQIQQTLVGDEDLTTISNPVRWGFHSPLMYWNNSAEAIATDDDVARTVNDRAGSASSLEVSLRPASVFAGKTFSNRKLVAADALVLTLMNRAEDNVGSKWQQKMHSLGDIACPQCQIYPPKGQVSPSWLYEFTFTPVTVRENTALALAYASAVLYILLSLRRLKAFHSRFGLMVTAITQMIMSVVASFTICGMLKVNLSAVPQNAYPFILMVIGSENMFRLINAILKYPATMATDLRIANGLGDVGPLSIATAVQNLLTLLILSRVVSPGIVAFCVFAAVATLVDTFFLLTFFVAVLNVDIRRLELQDSISRSNAAASHRTQSPTPARSWFDALLYGGLPLSTRMAGSITTTSFILTLNFLFFGRTEKKVSLRHLIGLVRGSAPRVTEFDTLASPPTMNATLTPGEWIRMQDFETAREVMRLVNDGAHSFVIRVFAPLMIVLSGSDRTGVPQGAQAWADELRAFMIHHLYPFLVVVVFIVTFVALLMNFLLWNGAPEMSEDISERDIEDRLTIEHIQTAHKLDIVKLNCAKGNIITAALDRTIHMSIIDRNSGLRQSVPLSRELLSAVRWPVQDVAIDDTGTYIALHTGDDVIVCNHLTNTIERSFQYPDHQSAKLFQFSTDASFLLLTTGGQLVVQPLTGAAMSASLHHGHVVDAATSITKSLVRLVTIHETSEVQYFEITSDSIISRGSIAVDDKPCKTAQLFLATAMPEQVLVCTIWTSGSAATINLADMTVTTRSTLVPASHYIPSYSSTRYAAIAARADKGPIEVVLAEAVTETTNRKHGSSEAKRSDDTDKASANMSLEIDGPTSFLSLTHDLLLGLRRKVRREDVTSRAKTTTTTLRQRHISRRTDQSQKLGHDQDTWEAYSFDVQGDFCSTEFDAAVMIEPSAATEHDPMLPLFVTKAEPSKMLDAQCGVFAFGNCLKIIRMSKSRSQQQIASSTMKRHGSITKRRGGPRKST